jgi:hypothetical protein
LTNKTVATLLRRFGYPPRLKPERYVSATISPIRSTRREVAMRTAIIIAVGFVLWAACLGVAKLLASSSTSSMITATVAFVVIWFVAAAANMWIGVSQAGYSVREELPIFLLIFVLPSAVAMFVKWKFL